MLTADSSAKAWLQRFGLASLHFVGFVDPQLISARRAALRKGRVPG
jgi:hypothetical protein